MPFTYTTWRSSAVSKFYPNSPRYQAVLDAAARYDGSKSASDLKDLARAILAWQATKLDWLRTHRRAAMIELVNYVKDEAHVRYPKAGRWLFNYLHCKAKFQEMVAAPQAFLANHVISIAGASDGLKTYSMRVDHGDPTYDDRALTTAASIYGGRPMYSFSPGTPQAVEFSATAIKMHTDFTSACNAAALQGKLVDVDQGADIVLTGQLTGCSFVIQTGGSLKATHIKPVGQSGNALHTQIDGFHLANTKVYGMNDYGGDAVMIIGFKSGGWQIFAQKVANRTDYGTRAVNGAPVQLHP